MVQEAGYKGPKWMEMSEIYFNRLVSHKIRGKVCKEETSFILNGGATVQGEGCKDYCTEWSLSPAIELLALQSIISPP